MRAPALALTLSLAACGGRGDLPAPAADPMAAAAATITAADMIDRIGVLAHDSMRGRDTPSPGLESAARYIVDEFRRMGLEGGAENGEFIQRYPFPLVGLDTTAASFTVAGIANAPTLRYGDDYLVFAGRTEALDAQPVFAGPAAAFAASTPAAGTLAGKLPIVTLTGAFDRSTQTTMMQAGRKAEAAGAQSIVFVFAPDFPAASFTQLRRFFGTPRRTLGGAVDMTSVLMTHDAAMRLFGAAGVDPARVSAETTPVALGTATVALRTPLQRYQNDTAPNVIAILRGSDPELADEYVVFSAHMDHVGVGRPDETGDSIYNGADDDASGTAALIEVAEAFTNLLERPRRSLVFLAVSGEEKGLLGSRWYSENPTLPLAQTVANINVDMIGRNSPDSVVVIGQDYSSLGPLVQQVGAARRSELGLTVSDDLWPEERFFFRSDHFNFARKEIPAIFFFTGTHADYHKPSDEVETIDGDKAARVARLIFYTAHAIADDVARPSWTEEGLSEVRALTGGR